ncbi:expressed unknown protein [Seminavis robusta]|uniref:Uncharacterized protein n=1 Tax=Seminavis robusta TaxID=568900 RepID=A0A9N8EE40_9STRA|nr:expressed unknown protein [Seminavis robusta]|eukprot:Sro1045_g234970.1 n/a (391) ;mRNA; r:4925-6097
MTPPTKKAKTEDIPEDTSGMALKEKALKLTGLDSELIDKLFAHGHRSILETMVAQAETIQSQSKKINNESKRRLIEDCPSMKLNLLGEKTSHTGKSKHDGAVSRVFPGTVLESEYDDTALGNSSHLLMKFGCHINTSASTGSVDVITESDFSSLIAAALNDAKELAEAATRRKFSVHHEFSLWSDRPDHLVVFAEGTRDPILAVEDKEPFATHDDKIPPPVLGQVFDYLMELRCLGHSAPFCVLSTFESSWMFWEDQEASNEIVKKKYKLAKQVPPVSPTQQPTTQEMTQSPQDLVADNGKAVTESVFADDSYNRNSLLMQSQKYGFKQLVPLLYTAILCGLARNPSARPKTLFDRKFYTGPALKLWNSGISNSKWVQQLKIVVGAQQEQ